MNNFSTKLTIGVDLGDRRHRVCVIDGKGEVVEETWVINTREAVGRYFSRIGSEEVDRVAMETGAHSRWVSHLLDEMGYKVLVGNARKLRMIWARDNKSDEGDAEMLARIARFDPQLLSPIRHRSRQAHVDLAVLKSRDILVKTRARLINHVRGVVKAHGCRVPQCSAASFHRKAADAIPGELRGALGAVVEQIEALTAKIRRYDAEIERISTERYPEAEILRSIEGVGPVTALAYVLTVEDPWRVKEKRSVGAFVGLVPKRDQSGQSERQLRISKAGNGYLRQLLVGCAHYILGPFGRDSELRRYGMRIAQRGGKNAKKRAVVAVARKLSVLMAAMWRNKSLYDPFYNSKPRAKAA